MADEQTTVSTETTTDVSTETNTQATTDNSGVSTEEIGKILDETENPEPEKPAESKIEDPQKTEQETQDNTIECPDKFKNKDGSANLEKILKSYQELESSSSKKETEWQKERAELLKAKEQLDEAQKIENERAKAAGYDSYQDMQQVYEVAYTEANEYAKYLQYTDDPEGVRQKLMQYANNPSAELMEEIELEFAPEVNKRVAIASERKRQEFAAQKQQYEQTLKMSSIENVIGQSVNANPELFNYEPFQKLFVSTLQKFGDAFTFDDAQALMNTFKEMENLYKEKFEKQTGAKIENEKATDKIAALNTQSSAPAARQYSNADIDAMSPEELAKEIRKLI